MVTLCRVVTEENRFVTYLIADCKSAVILRGELEIPANKKSLLSALLKCPHGLQPTNERRAESKLAYAMPSKEEEDKVKSLRTSLTLRSCRLSVAIPCRQVSILSLSESGTLAYQKWHFRGAKVPLFVSQMRSNVC